MGSGQQGSANIYIINDGNIFMVGSPGELLNGASYIYSRIGTLHTLTYKFYDTISSGHGYSVSGNSIGTTFITGASNQAAYWVINPQNPVLVDAPIGCWPLNEISGTLAYDASGYSNNGTYSGGFTLNQTGPFTGTSAVTLNGTSGIVTFPLITNITGNVSMECWFKTNSYTQANQVIMYNGTTFVNGYGIVLNGNSSTTGMLYCLYGGIAWGTSVATIVDTKWHHIALVISSTPSGVLYVDGVLKGTAQTTTPITPTTSTLLGYSSSIGYLNGGVCEFAIFNYALTAMQVYNHYTTLLIHVTVSVSAVSSIYIGGNNTITATFSSSLIVVPTLGTCSNGTVSGISGSGTIFTFIWTPTSTTSTSFNFTGVVGYAGILTSTNSLTPAAATTATVSGTSMLNIASTMTVVFSNSQTNPTCITSNVTNMSTGTGTSFTFTWVPQSTAPTSFSFTNVVGYLGTLISNTVTPGAPYVAYFNGSAYVTLTSGISTGSTWTFECWIKGVSADYPAGGTTFSSVFGATGAGSSVTTSAGVVCSGGAIYGTALNYVISANSTATFVENNYGWHYIAIVYNNPSIYLYKDGTLVNSNTSILPGSITFKVLGANANGNSSTYINFTGYMSNMCLWNTARTASQVTKDMNTLFTTYVPNLICCFPFNNSVTEIAQGLAFTNTSVTFVQDATLPLRATTVTSITSPCFSGVPTTLTAIFSNTLTALPTITPPNGTVSGASYSGNTVTYTWTPSAAYTISVSGTAYVGISNTITATVSSSISVTPTLGACFNGVVSNISGSGTTYTFTWVPVNTSATSFNFTNVIGYTSTITSTNTLTPIVGTTVSVSIASLAYTGMGNTVTAIFSVTQSPTPTLGTCANGTVASISGSSYTYTFTWTPTQIIPNVFNFTSVTGFTGTLTSLNSLTPLLGTTVIVSVYLNAYNGLANTVTAVFSNNQVSTPALGTCSNGTVASITSVTGTTYTFTWTPSSTTGITFNFTSVTGYSGTLVSSNTLTPVSQTTATVSGTAYTNIASTITVVFSNAQSGTVTLGTISNGTVSGISGSGTTFTFSWTSSTVTATSFTFTSVTGYSGTLTTINSLTPIVGTTATISGTAYQNIANTITVVFSNSQSGTPSLGTCSNGTVSSISGSGTTFTFTWTPTSVTSTSLNFTSVTGYPGTLTSGNSITPLVQTTATISGTVYIYAGNTITVVFSNTQSGTPLLNTVSNGTVTSFSGSGTTFTFTWTPSSLTSTSFSFTSVTGYSGTLTSSNSLTPLATMATVSGIAVVNVANTITVVFSCTQTTAPALGSCSNGTVTGMSTGSSTTYTFSWTPTSTTSTSLNFTNVTGYSGTLTSTNLLTPINAMATVSTTSIIKVSIANTITVVFSPPQTSAPTLGSCSNGTVSSMSTGTGTTYTFTWTPSIIAATSFNFTNVTGYSGTLTTSNVLYPNSPYQCTYVGQFIASSSQLVLYSNTLQLTASNSFTWEAWIKTNISSGGFVGLHAASTGLIIFQHNLCCADEPNSGKAIDDNYWHHVAVTCTANNAASQYYVDGIAVGSANFYNSGNPAGMNCIGYDYSNTAYCNGKICEVRFWNISLTQTYIQNNMNTRYTIPYPTGLIAYVTMDNNDTDLIGNLTSPTYNGSFITLNSA